MAGMPGARWAVGSVDRELFVTRALRTTPGRLIPLPIVRPAFLPFGALLFGACERVGILCGNLGNGCGVATLVLPMAPIPKASEHGANEGHPDQARLAAEYDL